MGRNKQIRCQVCLKNFRSDKIKYHLERHEGISKYPMKTCSICKKSMIAWNLPRHNKVHNELKKTILENMKVDNINHENIAKTGQILKGLLDGEDIDPICLRKEYLKALEINDGRKKHIFEKLKPWQLEVLDMMKPSQRQIIWITGEKGAEGKSWFQDYIEQYYGCKRVFRTSADKNIESILHALSKRTLSLIDVFVFNIARSFDIKRVPYTLFEDIKDGQSISTKYDSKILKFSRPNILIVFSNKRPFFEAVSKDRWRTYNIASEKNPLKEVQDSSTSYILNNCHPEKTDPELDYGSDW